MPLFEVVITQEDTFYVDALDEETAKELAQEAQTFDGFQGDVMVTADPVRTSHGEDILVGDDHTFDWVEESEWLKDVD